MNDDVVQGVTVDEQMTQEKNVKLDNDNEQEASVDVSVTNNTLSPQALKLQRYKKEIHERESICEQIECLQKTLEEDTSYNVEQLQLKWQELPSIPPEYQEILQKRFQKACDAFKMLKEQQLKEREEFEKRQAALKDLVTQMNALLPVDNWPDCEKKFYAIQTAWNKTFIDDGSCNDILNSFNQSLNQLQSIQKEFIAAKEQHYAEIKARYSEVISLIKQYLASDDEIKHHHQDIRAKKHSWSADRKLLYAKDENLVHELDHLFKEFFDRLNQIFQEADWHRWENYTLKEDLIKIVAKQENEENLFNVSHKLKELRQKWKEIGPVPREKSDEQWERFNSSCNKLYEKCHQFFEKLDHERKDHYETKVKLCEKVEAIKESTKWKETAEQIKHIQDEWKTVGPVPKEKDHELWERFNAACNVFFDKRRAHFDIVKSEQGKNKEAKEKLCEEAEKLVQDDWKDGFHHVHDLRDKWKHIAPAKREDEQKLWQRFNNAIDTFYAMTDEQRPQNLLQKQALCKQVHELLDHLDENVHYKSLSAKVDKLVAQWKTIGPVPKDVEDATWQEFNTPIQLFHEKKREFFDHLKAEKEENLKKKEALIAKLEELLEKNYNWNETAGGVKAIQQEWRSIGAVPKENDKAVWDHFNVLCNGFFNKRRDFFHDMKSKKQDNLKKKIDLCIRIEHIAGISSPEQDISKMKAMSLEEELKFAIMDNSSAPKLNRKNAMDEVKKMQRDWKVIGPVPKADDQRIFQRYRRACDAFFGKRD